LTRGQKENKSSRRDSSLTSRRRRVPQSSRRFASPLITLLTDFGTRDHFVAAVKGVILGLNPQARLVDITHEIPPQDIEAAAFTLLAACSSFPAGSIHVAVVDPGVGSSRRAILIDAGEQLFVGPDNGIFSYVCDTRAGAKIFHLTNTKYFRNPVSATFNGRDVFAPVAAALSNGVKPNVLGTKITDYVRLQPLKPEASKRGRLKGRIIHIDRFGNCITNITPKDLTAETIAAGAKLKVKGKLVESFKNYFAEKTDRQEKIFAIWGSAGFLEIVAANQSAAQLLNARRGEPVVVSVG
jgi:S-adenosylmethionine hydrolase